MAIQTVSTFAPIFSGFYSTPFECDDTALEDEANNLNETITEINNKITSINIGRNINEPLLSLVDECDFEIDYTAYNKGVAVDVCATLIGYFPCVSNIKFERVVSPRQYNFSNDSIDCDITVDTEVLRETLLSKKDELVQWLKDTYTSRSGFISSYSNEFSDWMEYTKDFTDFSGGGGHYLGTLLNFVAQSEGIDDWYLADDTYESRYISEYITNYDSFIPEEWQGSHDSEPISIPNI